MAKLKINNYKATKKKLVSKIMADVTKSAKDILDKDVAKLERKTMQRVIKEKTYDRYKPTKYKRRGASHDGLMSRNNILTYSDIDNQNTWASLTITNVASPNDSVLGSDITDGAGLLYEWKDTGSIYPLFNHSGKPKPYEKPATYTETIEKRLYDSGAVKELIIQKLKDKYE